MPGREHPSLLAPDLRCPDETSQRPRDRPQSPPGPSAAPGLPLPRTCLAGALPALGRSDVIYSWHLCCHSLRGALQWNNKLQGHLSCWRLLIK